MSNGRQHSDRRRVEILERHGILDSPPEPFFDSLARVAAWGFELLHSTWPETNRTERGVGLDGAFPELAGFLDEQIALRRHGADPPDDLITRMTRAEADGPGATVESRIVDQKNGRDVAIRWRLRPNAGQMKVRDVLIENISMAQTQRREFAAVLQQRGGKAEGLIAAIREKIADLDRR